MSMLQTLIAARLSGAEGSGSGGAAAQDVTIRNVEGTAVSIPAAYDTKYQCGTLRTLTWTHPGGADYGVYVIAFTSGPTATEVTVPAGVRLNADSIEADTYYEISVDNAGWGAVAGWAAES